MSKPTVAVDFDGVIHEHKDWQGPEGFGEPICGAARFLERLAAGHRVVIFTTRCPGRVVRWLEEKGLAHLVARVTGEKPLAIAYVDDRAVRFRGDFGEAFDQIREPPWWKTDQEK